MAISSIPSDIFRKAEETDIERIWQIIGQAKAQMQRLGSQQWDENYPAIEHIRQDIQDGNGYVICREDRVVACLLYTSFRTKQTRFGLLYPQTGDIGFR